MNATTYLDILTDTPMKVLGISDPKTWAAQDWVSDIVPLLLYGTVAYATIVTQETAP